MLVDCFNFCGEFPILRIRLAELAGLVDEHWVCESNATYSGLPRAYQYIEGSPNIRHLKFRDPGSVEEIAGTEEYLKGKGDRLSFAREVRQGEWAYEKLQGLPPGTLILWGDVDEIPRREILEKLVESYVEPVRLYLTPFRYYLNMGSPGYADACSILMRRDHLMPWFVARDYKKIVERDVGWHFSSMGGELKILEKLRSFSHQEYNRHPFNTLDHIRWSMETGKDLFERGGPGLTKMPMSMLPKYVEENPEEFAGMLR